MAALDAEQEPAARDDLRSALTAAFDASESAQSDAAPKSGSREPKEPGIRETGAKEPPAREPSADRSRSPDGKFAARAETQTDGTASEPAVTLPKEPKTSAESPATGAKEAPANWPEADRTAFKALPSQAQDFLLRRHTAMEADYTRKTQAVAALQNDYGPIQAMFAPHSETLRQKGFTPASLVKAWYDVEQALIDPAKAVDTVKMIVNGYKIPADKLAVALGLRTIPRDGTPPAPEPANNAPIAIPPEVMERLTRHDAWIAGQEQQRQTAQRQQYDSDAQRVMTAIEEFASATDGAGAMLHPHFQAVEDDMHRLVLATRASGKPIPPLSELYDQAVWANPSIRRQMLDAERAADQAQRAKAEETRRAEARAKAEQSRRAGASVNGSPGGAPQGSGRRGSNGSVRDDISAAMEEIE